jgi:hypothetical protein
MKAISLWQPFASLIFAGVKTFETRSWKYPAKLRGQRIAIHATAKFTPPSMISPALDALCEEVFGPGYVHSLPRSAILGTALVSECHKTDDLYDAYNDVNHITSHNLVCGDWLSGRYAWALTDVEAFPMAIPARGNQMLWEWNPEVVDDGRGM